MKKKWIVRIYSVLIFALCMYVPWAAMGTNGYGASIYQNHGYSFIWSPPKEYSQIDKTKLLLPLLGLTALFGVAWYQSKE